MIEVIMLSYNHSATIERAINSVLSQKTDYPLTGKFTYKKSADCPNCEFLDKLFSDIQHRSYREKYLYHEVFVYLHGGDELCNWNELCNWKEE